MIKLRPHHLLCTKAYEGMGYSKEFVKNMDEKIVLLRGEEPCKIQIVKALDSLCKCCPHNKGKVCETEEKVNSIDEKVCKALGLEEEEYIYQELSEKISNKITKENMEYICGECEWFSSGRCTELIVKQSKQE